MKQSAFLSEPKLKGKGVVIGALFAILTGWLTVTLGIVLPVILLVIALVLPFVITVFYEPRIGFVAYIIYSFFIAFLGREVADLPFLYGIEIVLFISWIAALLHNSKEYNWSFIKNDLCILGLIWFGITVLELGNPAGANPLGWFTDGRYPLLWVLSVPLCMVIFNKKKDLNLFIIIIISISILACLNGIKQLKIGLFPGEQLFLDSGGYKTHILFGQLRVFSFYPDAGQFGASMAQMCVIALVLALGPFKIWKRILLGGVAAFFLYGMSISGTRGALFALVTGILMVLILDKNIKLKVLVLAALVIGLVFLKYTYIGQGNSQIRRMRTSLNPEDPSLQLRLGNQLRLRSYLSSHPFGGGIGSIGYGGRTYNKGSFLASVPPDSYWVKVWAMYGIVGLIIWVGIMMYIVGKGCGILWKIKDQGLRYKLTALHAGAFGIFFCSYGNEVINIYPSAVIVYVSWAFVFLGPYLDKKTNPEKILNTEPF